MPVPITLFGATSPSGQALIALAAGRELVVAGRRPPLPPASGGSGGGEAPPFLRCDLEDTGAGAEVPAGLLVSFAPIWSFAPWLERFAGRDPAGFGRLQGVIACSSSSVITKRFAANRFDRDLVRRLRQAEESLSRTCAAHARPLRILAPTLIYGQAGPLGDRNLSRLRQLLRRLPLLPLPGEGGLRQPIHCRQLAAVALHLADRLAEDGFDPSQPVHLPLGGDDTLSYAAMLRRLQDATDRGIGPAAAACWRCRRACSCPSPRRCCCSPRSASRRCCAWAPTWPASRRPTAFSGDPPNPFPCCPGAMTPLHGPGFLLLGAGLGALLLHRLLPLLRRQLVDQPNARSSHQRPTPRGGGLAFVLVGSALAPFAGEGWPAWVPLICLPLALVGLLDDRLDLPAAGRYGVQIATALALVAISPLALSWWLVPVAVFAATAVINFVNFSDGLDGLVAGCAAVLLTVAFLAMAPDGGHALLPLIGAC